MHDYYLQRRYLAREDLSSTYWDKAYAELATGAADAVSAALRARLVAPDDLHSVLDEFVEMVEYDHASATGDEGTWLAHHDGRETRPVSEVLSAVAEEANDYLRR